MGVTGVTSERGLHLHPDVSLQPVHFLRGAERRFHGRGPGPALLEALPHADALRPLQTGPARAPLPPGEKARRCHGTLPPRAASGCCRHLLLERAHLEMLKRRHGHSSVPRH